MIDLFKDIFDYNRVRNREMIVLCMNNEADVPEKTIQLFCHNLNAHHIWNQRILGKESRFGVWDFHIINSWNSLDKKNYEDSMEIIASGDLERIITFKDSKGDAYENKLRDILFHVANHHNYHRAQIVSNLKEAGIQPEKTDYIFYKR
jgi:uncharacterized damage-inducible protein DinB